MATPEERGISSNWGRWGADDQRGTANLLTDGGVLAAAQRVRTARCSGVAPFLSGKWISAPWSIRQRIVATCCCAFHSGTVMQPSAA